MIGNGGVATLAATAIVSLAIGFGAASLLPGDQASSQPLIDPDAWHKTAPAPAGIQPVNKVAAMPRCSEWAISDAAMEAVLDEMIRRGWNPPTQGQAIAAMDVTGLSVQDPNAPMPYRAAWPAPEPATEASVVIESDQSDALPAEGQPIEAEKPAPPPA